MKLKSLKILLLFIFFISRYISAEELLLKYDFTNGSNLPVTKIAGLCSGNEFSVYNTTSTPMEMILQPEVDYLIVRNSATAVDQRRYGYISVGAEKGYSITITRVEITSKKGNSNTLNARCYLYDSLKDTPLILSNMIYSGTNAGYTIPDTWETKGFVPLAGSQLINDTVYFSFTSTQSQSNNGPAEWDVDQISFYGTISGGDEITNDVSISIDVTKPKHVISKLLNGSHFVYGNESDSIYKDERISEWMKSSKVGIIRWPGGTAVMSYHWDDLTGDNFGPDRWDTENYIDKNIPPSNYMDLDEYIAYCRKVKAEPMVGVNIRSGKFYKTDADGLNEARRLIQYCVDKNYNVKHWYIGNEGYVNGFNASIYAQYIDLYAAELKKVDPNIIIIGDWKFGPEDAGRYNQLLSIIQGSSQIDVMEVHEKWGNEWGLVSGLTVADWKTEFPLYGGKLDYYCKRFQTDVKNLGKDTKLSMNEWGIGAMTDGTNYDYALLAADYMTQIYKNDIYSACFWNLNISSGDENKSRIFLTKNSGLNFDKFNPIAKVFQMYSSMLEENFLEVTSSDQKVYGVASVNSTKDTIQLLLLNKSAVKSKINLTTNGFSANNAVLIDGFNESGISKVDEINNGNMSFVLPEYSFTRLQFTGNATTYILQYESETGEMIVSKRNNSLQINLPNDVIHSLSVINLCSAVIRKTDLSEGQNQIEIKNIKPGIYCILVGGDKRNYVRKTIF